MATLKLSNIETINLIKMYKECGCLWNFRNEHYKCPNVKRRAWAKIASQYHCTADEVKTKLKYLRNAYICERKKVRDSRKSCSDGDVYKPHLFYFNELKYLDSVIVWRKRCTNPDEEKSSNSMVDETETSFADAVECSEPEPIKKHRKYGKPVKKMEYVTEDSVESPANSNSHQFKAEEDTFTIFGKSIGLQLKNLPPIRASQMMAQIQTILTEETISVLYEKEKNMRSKNLSRKVTESNGNYEDEEIIGT